MVFRYLFIFFSALTLCFSAKAQSDFPHPEKENDVERAGFVGNVKKATQYAVKWEKNKAVKGQPQCTWKFNKEKQLTECTYSWRKRIRRYNDNGDCIEDTYTNSDSVVYEQTLRKFKGKNLLTEEKVFKRGKLSMEQKNSYDQKNRLVSSSRYNHEQNIPYSELKINYDKNGNMLDSVFSNYSHSENKCVPYVAIHNTFNMEGKITERVEQKWDGESRFEYEYNSLGQLHSRKYYRQTEGLVELSLYNDSGRVVCSYNIKKGLKDSMEYDPAGRLVKSVIYSISQPIKMFQEYTNTYDANGNKVESLTKKSSGEWEKWVWEYKNGQLISSTTYYGKGDKFRKKSESSTPDESNPGDDELISPYEYVDEPWTNNKSTYEYDQWGNKTSINRCNEHGDCQPFVTTTYEGYNRPTKTEFYHNGEISKRILTKTDSATNTTEKLTFENGEFRTGVIFVFEYYDK